MQVAILAAGLGTRLRPLTYTTPKALVPVLNRPLLGVLLAQLREAGALRVALNTHHLADQVQHFLGANFPQGLEVVVRHEPEILGTGGGLRSLAQALEGWPLLISTGLIPLLLTLGGLAIIYLVLRWALKASHSETLVGMFALMAVGLVLLTVVGVYFRGPNMALVLPF